MALDEEIREILRYAQNDRRVERTRACAMHVAKSASEFHALGGVLDVLSGTQFDCVGEELLRWYGGEKSGGLAERFFATLEMTVGGWRRTKAEKARSYLINTFNALSG